MMPQELDARPRVLGVRFGVNPNSSSLGVDVTYLLFGGTLAVIASMVLGAWLRTLRDKAQEHGAPPADETP
jgi:hypothetical protein